MKKNGMVWILCLFFILFCPRSVYAEEFVSTKNGLDVMFVMEKGKIIGQYTKEEAKDQDIEDLFFDITGGDEG